MTSLLAFFVVLFGMFSAAVILSSSRAAVLVGSFGFGVSVWLLHGAVAPEYRSMVLPGLMLWPFMTPAGAALLWWRRTSPQPSRFVGAAFAIFAIALALAGGVIAHLLGA